MKPGFDSSMPDPAPDFDDIYSGDYYSSQPSSPEPEENEEPRKFKAGDRVRVNDSWEYIDEFLQEDNRVGTVIDVVKGYHKYYWLHMDKPVIKEEEDGDGEERPSIIPEGYAYFSFPYELELLESVPESQKPFDIDQWRKNLKPGDKVMVVENPRSLPDVTFARQMNKRKSCEVTLKVKEKHSLSFAEGWTWRIEEDEWHWHPSWFEPVDKSKLSKPKKTKESKKQPLDPRLKNLIQTALELIQIIETIFKETQKYPIFGINLAAQEPEEKTRKSSLGESLLSLGVVLYHLYTGESEHNNHSYLLDGYPKPEDMPEEFWQVVNKLLKSEYRSSDEFKEDLKQTNKDSP